MNTLNGSTRIESSNLRFPAESHVHAIETSLRSSGERVSRLEKQTTAAANESATDPVEITPAARRESALPPSAITATAASGVNRQIQAVVIAVTLRLLRRRAASRSPSPRPGPCPPGRTRARRP